MGSAEKISNGEGPDLRLSGLGGVRFGTSEAIVALGGMKEHQPGDRRRRQQPIDPALDNRWFGVSHYGRNYAGFPAGLLR